MAMTEGERWDMIHVHRIPKRPLSERAPPVLIGYGVKVQDWRVRLLRRCPAWKLVALSGVVIIGLLALVPPFRYTYRPPISLRVYAGHALIFSPPDARRDPSRPRYTQYRMDILPTTEVDVTLLLLECSGVGLLSGAVSVLLFRRGGRTLPSSQSPS